MILITLHTYPEKMEVFKRNGFLITIIFIWLLAGLGGPVIYGVIPITMFLMKRKNMYQELLLGFFFILIMSDSRQHGLAWADTAKNEYIVLLAVFLFFDRKSFAPFNYFYQKFIPFFIIAFICLFFAPNEILFTAFEKTLSYLLLLIVVPNYVVRSHNDHGERFYQNLIYFTGTILFAGFIIKFVHNEQAYMEGRYRGLLGNPNGLGVFTLMVFLTFSIVQDLYPKLFSSREKAVMYILIFLSLLMSNSRNSLFAVLIYFFFSYFYKISPFLGFIFFVVFIAVDQYLSTHLAQIVEALGLSDYLRVDTLENASGRFIAWDFARDQIKHNIWIGRGFEYTDYLFQENAEWLSNLGHQGNAHNSYLTLWLNTGFFGLAAYGWAFLSSFIQAAKKSKLVIPIMYAVIFSTIFESWLTASLNPFTIQIFIILSILTTDVIIPAKTAAAIPV